MDCFLGRVLGADEGPEELEEPLRLFSSWAMVERLVIVGVRLGRGESRNRFLAVF